MGDVPIVGVLFLLAVVSAPLWVRRLRAGAPAAGVRVVTRTALSRSSTLAVVEVDGRRLLLGAGDQGVRLLTELDPDDRTDAAPGTEPAADPTAASPFHGPRIGLLDRLRVMTVRSTPQGRPPRVPFRR